MRVRTHSHHMPTRSTRTKQSEVLPKAKDIKATNLQALRFLKPQRTHIPVLIGDVIEISSDSEDECGATLVADLRKQIEELQEVFLIKFLSSSTEI
jgi:hypothetical protein